MDAGSTIHAAPAAREPWFRRAPALSVLVAVVLFAGILVLRLLDSNATDAISMLYALPVALVALAFGVRAGTAAGLVALALTGLWVAVDDVTITVLVADIESLNGVWTAVCDAGRVR